MSSAGAFFPPAVGSGVSRSRERSPARKRQSRSRSRSRSPRGSSSRHDRPTSGAGSASASKNRAECTIFVSQLHPKLDEMDIFEFFSHVGRVEDIQLIKDNRGKSKGLSYVEFGNKDDAFKSQVLNGQLVGGYPITIAMAQAGGASSSSSNSSSRGGGGRSGSQSAVVTNPDGLRIYVGSLNFNITEADLRPIFEAFGPLTSVEIHRDPATQQSKGFGFISFSLRADGETAMAALDNFEIAGRQIKIGYASPTDVNGKNPRPAAVGAPHMILPPGLGQAAAAAASALHMGVPPPSVVAAVPSLPTLTPAQLVPSAALLVKNLFDAATETEPNWFIELEEDVRDEVEKHGKLHHILVDKDSRDGLVWMRFEQVAAAQQAQKALHGRAYAGRIVTAEFVPEAAYTAQFP